MGQRPSSPFPTQFNVFSEWAWCLRASKDLCLARPWPPWATGKAGAPVQRLDGHGDGVELRATARARGEHREGALPVGRGVGEQLTARPAVAQRGVDARRRVAGHGRVVLVRAGRPSHVLQLPAADSRHAAFSEGKRRAKRTH